MTVVLMMVTGRQPYQIGWVPKPGLGSVRDLALLALGPTLPLVVLVSVLVLIGLLPTGSRPERRLRALAVPLLALPATVLLAVSFFQPVFVPRYVFPSVVGALCSPRSAWFDSAGPRLGAPGARRSRSS